MATILPRWVNQTQQFQELAFINRAVIDIAGVDVPRVALARNPVERREILFRQAVIVFAAFILAPLHALAFLYGLSRGRHAFNPLLLRVPFSQLRNTHTLTQGLKELKTLLKSEKQLKQNQLLQKLFSKATQEALPHQATEALRKRLLKAKTAMIMLDLTIEGLIFANLGWIKNWFGQWLTGKKQFTGELNIVSQDKLDALYAKTNKKIGFSEQLRKSFTTITAIAFPVGIGLAIRKYLAHPKALGAHSKRLLKLFQQFDYQRGYLLGFGAFVVIGVFNDLGDILAARSTHERREIALKSIPLTIMFLYGDRLWMKLFTLLAGKSLKVPAEIWLKDAIQKAPKQLKKAAGRQTAALYWLSFVMSTLSLCALIVFNNRWTTKKVKQEAAALTPQQPTPSSPLVDSPPKAPVLPAHLSPGLPANSTYPATQL